MNQVVEAQVAELLRQRDMDRAATAALEAYGSELYGFLINVVGSVSEAAEVFSQTAEDFWSGLPSFRGDCSVRTWLYVLAQHAAARYRRSPWNRGQRTGTSKLDDVVATVATRTAPWQRTDVKDRWRELRDSLEPDDRALLVLRVDRDLEWLEVARIMLVEGEDEPTAAALTREAARLRKRFQLLKDELRQRARAAGLLEDAAG